MKVNVASVAVIVGTALGAMPVLSAQAEPAPADQARIAETTRKLEDAFRDQFLTGNIDRRALSAPIAEVVRAMPEAARPRVREHIDEVLRTGADLAARMTPEERAAASAPPAPETTSKTQQAIVSGWGWPNYGGFGGYGAFGFPGMYYGASQQCSSFYNAYSVNGWGNGYGAGGCTPVLGTTGWYW
jgi:hypothetical protein